ncbi:TPA: hypothetical protein H2C15_004735 [Salmonella enterica]|nr:hypothetical protein [Salmonella enterica]
MKWDNIFILSFNQNNGLLKSHEDIVTITSDAMIMRYFIKHQNCYSLNRVTRIQDADILGEYYDIYKDCMKTDGELTKLVVVGHYETFNKLFTPYRFAELIRFCGAQSVTYISFKVCSLGETDYLYKLRDYLPGVHLFSGYKGSITPDYFCKNKKIKYSIRLTDNVAERVLHKISGEKLPDVFRRTVIFGHSYNPAFFLGTKYYRGH